MTTRRSLTSQAVQQLTQPTEPWLSCDHCFEQVDVAVDALLLAAEALSEPLRVHLLGCAACDEEGRALVGLVAAEHGMAPVDAIDVFDAALQRTR